MAKDLHALQARHIMTTKLVCATPSQDLAQADEMLIEHRISGMPVIENGKLVGVLSRSDIARVAVLMDSLDGEVTDQMAWPEQADGFQHNVRPDSHVFQQMIAKLKVKDAMHDQVFTCRPEAALAEVASIMVRLHVHRVIVVEDDRPVGIISSLDVVKLLADPVLEQAGN